VRAPKANAFAERFVRTARAECLDWLLIMNRRHLERVLRIFAQHYNTHRPHRSLNLAPPALSEQKAHAVRRSPTATVERRDRLGGLIHEYNIAASNRICAPFRTRKSMFVNQELVLAVRHTKSDDEELRVLCHVPAAPALRIATRHRKVRQSRSGDPEPRLRGVFA